jgi:hypothetical protein
MSAAFRRRRFVADRLGHLVGVRSYVAAIVKGRFGSILLKNSIYCRDHNS